MLATVDFDIDVGAVELDALAQRGIDKGGFGVIRHGETIIWIACCGYGSTR